MAVFLRTKDLGLQEAIGNKILKTKQNQLFVMKKRNVYLAAILGCLIAGFGIYVAKACQTGCNFDQCENFDSFCIDCKDGNRIAGACCSQNCTAGCMVTYSDGGSEEGGVIVAGPGDGDDCKQCGYSSSCF